MQLWTLHSKLLLAIQDNDLERAEDILRQGVVDPDVKFSIGHGSNVPAICLCVERGLYQMAKLLIEYGCSVNQVDDSGYTALHFSVSHQFLDLVKLLIGNRANVNAVSNYGQTALHLACQQSSVDILSCLIEAGANPERTDGDGRTPLAMACICNQTEVARYLVQEAKVDVECDDNCGNTPLLHAINSGLSLNLELVRILLQAGADPNHFNRHGHSALFTVVRRASEHSLEGIMAVEQLIGHGCNLNDSDSGEPVIHLTISRGQDRITEALVRSGADVNVRNERGFSPLHRVAREEKVDLVNLLIAAGADVHLPKHFYTDEAGHMRDIKCPEIRHIFSLHTRKVPTLKHMARVSIRQWLERRADSVIKQLPFPLPLKRYLLLMDS